MSHGVAETFAFRRAARAADMSDDEIDSLIQFLSDNPEAGDEIPGTGGCRKLRFGRPGTGKRGGLRVITFFSGTKMPVFLITVFAKGEKATLSKAECNDLKTWTKQLVAEYAEHPRH